MPGSRKYTSAGALRQALEERLKAISRREHTDFQRLCRQVAFDRFLARLSSLGNPDWILKGGYAMELRFDAARSTRDLDFTLRNGNSDSALDLFQRAAFVAVGDFFTFRVGAATADLDSAPYGGARYPVEARLDGRVFVRFHVDAGIGDVILEPIETLTTRDWLEFAGIPPPFVPMIGREQQFAEKIHAYSVPRSNSNSRVRDLVDLYFLVAFGRLDRTRCVVSLRQTFERRGTHGLPVELAPPPPEWERPFQAMAGECEIEMNCQAAFEVTSSFWSGLNVHSIESQS